MHIIPTQDEVVAVLRETGALRDGHFEYPSGLHSNEYLQVPLAMRYYQHQRMLSVGLSRLLRANPEIRAIVPELSDCRPDDRRSAGGIRRLTEALRAKQVYWAEREHDNEPLHFRQYLEQQPGEQVVIVDDILRTGKKLAELKRLLESRGRDGGRSGGDDLSAHAEHPRFRQSAAVLSGEAGRQILRGRRALRIVQARHAAREGLGLAGECRQTFGNTSAAAVFCQCIMRITCTRSLLNLCAECDKRYADMALRARQLSFPQGFPQSRGKVAVPASCGPLRGTNDGR